MQTADSIMDAALDYHRRGLNVVPCNDGANDRTGEGKAPKPGFTLARWYYYKQSRADVERAFEKDAVNVGIITGKGSDNVYVVDVDHPDQFPDQTFLKSAFDGDLNTWAVKTSRGLHTYDISTRQIKTKAYGWGEIRGMQAYVLAPPSVNVKTGIAYTWLSRPSSIAHCEELPFATFDYDDFPRHQVPRLAQLISDGKLNDQVGVGKRYRSRSEIDAALVLSLYRASFTFDQVKSWFPFCKHPSQYLDYLNTHRKQADNYLRVLFYKAEHLADKPEWTQARTLALSCNQWAVSTSWPGRTGETDRAIYLTHTLRCYESGSLEYHLSSRKQSEQAAYGYQTASNANHRLIRKGLIHARTRAKGDCAQKWALRPVGKDVAVSYEDTSKVTEHDEVSSLETLAGHARYCGVWEWHGLGKAAFAVWHALLEEPLTQKEVAARTGRAKGTVSKALARMSDAEIVGLSLVRRNGDRWFANSDYDFPRLGEKLRTASIGTLRHARHERERLAQREKFELAKALQGQAAA
jgi:hypothetical protein